MKRSSVPEIVLPTYDEPFVVRDALRVGDDINAEFRKQARLYGIVSFVSSDAKRKVRQLRDEMEVVKARIRRVTTKRYRESRLTVDFMKAIYVRKKSYNIKQKELNDAIYYEELVSGLLRALDHKRDALVGISANQRKELPDELRALSKEMIRRRKKREED